jgi:Family of unknown function (DUF6081)
MRKRSFLVSLVVAVVAFGVVGSAFAAPSQQTSVVYDSFQAPGGYTLSDYAAKWANIYGLGDMAESCADGSPAHGDTRSFADGTLYIDDAPFTCGFDFSVFDHLKYIAISNQAFPVPPNGSLTFSSVINAETPGTQSGHVVHGTFGPPGSYPGGDPYSATVFEGQQAGAVMNMINFSTGQLFDWFISGSRAFTLIERLPSSVTGNTTDVSSSDWVGPDKMYTQIIDEFPISPGPHQVAITYTRGTGNGDSTVEYFLDGKRVSKVKKVGVPLDRQNGVKWTGTYPSFGPGEDLKGKLDSFAIGHGTFSLLDAFPYQWGWGFTGCDPLWAPICATSVSIPLSERLFGQGARAHFDDFTVDTVTH